MGTWLLTFPKQYADVRYNLEIYVGLDFVRDKGTEATANNTIPTTLVLLVECLADGFCNLAVDVSAWGRLLVLKCLYSSGLSQFLHLGAHVDGKTHGLR